MLKNNNIKTLLALSIFSSAFFVCGNSANATIRQPRGSTGILGSFLRVVGLSARGNSSETQKLLDPVRPNPNYGTFSSSVGSKTSTTGSGSGIDPNKNSNSEWSPYFYFGLRSFR